MQQLPLMWLINEMVTKRFQVMMKMAMTKRKINSLEDEIGTKCGHSAMWTSLASQVQCRNGRAYIFHTGFNILQRSTTYGTLATWSTLPQHKLSGATWCRMFAIPLLLVMNPFSIWYTFCYFTAPWLIFFIHSWSNSHTNDTVEWVIELWKLWTPFLIDTKSSPPPMCVQGMPPGEPLDLRNTSISMDRRFSSRCHAPNRFGTVNMEDNINIKQSWCEGWAQRSLIVAIYRTKRLSWCKRWLPTSSSHHSHKNCKEAEETEGITSIMVWERNAIYCSPTPIPERAKKLKN